MRCCHRYPRCAGCQVEDKRFNHAPKNGLRVFVAELAKVLDILRPQNKKKDKQPQLTTLCEDVWLHLYAYSISASVFYSTSCWNCWVQLAPVFSLFIIWYYRDIIGYNCISLSFLTFSLCIHQYIYQYTIQFFNIYITSISTASRRDELAVLSTNSRSLWRWLGQCIAWTFSFETPLSPFRLLGKTPHSTYWISGEEEVTCQTFILARLCEAEWSWRKERVVHCASSVAVGLWACLLISRY